jgi:hypothetical protein
MKTQTKIAKQVIAAKKMIAAVDAAEKAAEERGNPLTDEELKKLGYVETEGNVWELPIPMHISALLHPIPPIVKPLSTKTAKTLARLRSEYHRLYWVDPSNPDNNDPERFHKGLLKPETTAMLAARKKLEEFDAKIQAGEIK